MPSISFLNHLGALLTLWLLLCCGAPAAENGRILMVTEATFPPYEFRDGNTILGIDPEIMREVARRTGRELVIEDMSFDSVITAVVSGKADAAASGITVTPERRRKVDFSIPYVEAAQVIIVPKGSPIRKREDIRGKKNRSAARGHGRHLRHTEHPAAGTLPLTERWLWPPWRQARWTPPSLTRIRQKCT